MRLNYENNQLMFNGEPNNMKLLKPSLLAAFCALLAAVALPAQATLVNDDYWGANAGSECLGCPLYGIDSANVTRNGNLLTISINTDFAGQGGLHHDTIDDTGTVAGMSLGIGYGDLFLSNAWNPVGASPHKTDEASNGTHWTYGLAFANKP